MKRWSGVVMIALAVLSISACGGSDGDDEADTTASPEQAVSKGEFIQQADPICEEFDSKLEASSRKFNAAQDERDIPAMAEAYRQAAEDGQDGIDQLMGLTPPNEDEQIVNRWRSGIRDQVTLLRRTADALEDGDLSEARTLLESGTETAGEIRGLAQGYGFKECGSDD